MSLIGKLVSKVEVKSSGDVVFDTFAHKPYQLVNGFPDIVQSCELLEGVWGILGCIISVNYTQEGEKQSVKMIIDGIDENTKTVTYKALEGHLLLLYTVISITVHVGIEDGKNFVTWTMDYLKLNPFIPDPTALMDLAVTITKGIDAKNI